MSKMDGILYLKLVGRNLSSTATFLPTFSHAYADSHSDGCLGDNVNANVGRGHLLPECQLLPVRSLFL